MDRKKTWADEYFAIRVKEVEYGSGFPLSFFQDLFDASKNKW